MKLVVLFIFVLLPWIARVGDWALRWTEGDEKLQIVFVMMLFPVIMNALQYYIIDSFIKKKQVVVATASQLHLPSAAAAAAAALDVGDNGCRSHGESLNGSNSASGSVSSQTLLEAEDESHDGLMSDDEHTVKLHRPRAGGMRANVRMRIRSRSPSPSTDSETAKLISPELLPAE
jgi:hypothetical protein